MVSESPSPSPGGAPSGPSTPKPPDRKRDERGTRPTARHADTAGARQPDRQRVRAKLRRVLSAGEHRVELLHEATVMVLYVSVIEIAELAALPEGHYAGGHVTGPVDGVLLAIVWGTAIGLAIAHWFAFRLAAPAFRGERPKRLDTQIGLAQFAGAVAVAAVSSLPVLVFSDVRAQETIGDVPAVLVGAVGYLVARHAGARRLAAVFYGLTALALGVLVALVKTKLAAH